MGQSHPNFGTDSPHHQHYNSANWEKLLLPASLVIGTVGDNMTDVTKNPVKVDEGGEVDCLGLVAQLHEFSAVHGITGSKHCPLDDAHL